MKPLTVFCGGNWEVGQRKLTMTWAAIEFGSPAVSVFGPAVSPVLTVLSNLVCKFACSIKGSTSTIKFVYTFDTVVGGDSRIGPCRPTGKFFFAEMKFIVA